MRKVLLSTLALAAMLTLWAAPAAAIPYPQCPAIGMDTTGCEVLFTRNPNGSFTTAPLSGEGPYDGVEDALYGIVNNGPDTLPSIVLGGIANLYGFDLDGGCSGAFPGTVVVCTGGDSSGYGGFVSSNQTPVLSGAANNVFFTGINAALSSGTVNFRGGIPVGGSAWFTLEESVTLTGPPTIGGGGAVPEPATLSLLGMGLAGVWRSRRKLLRQRQA